VQNRLQMTTAIHIRSKKKCGSIMVNINSKITTISQETVVNQNNNDC